MRRILLIEDNDENQDMLSRYLELFDSSVVVARDGVSGLQQAQDPAANFDLILMDMNLPDIDGWALAGRMKADAATSHLPIIAVTAHAMVGDREKVLAAGCDDYATKPIDFASLIQKIEALCPKVTLA